MAKLAPAANITRVPSMYRSALDGPRGGTRQDAIDGHREIARRRREPGVDTNVVCDTHWLVDANDCINCAPHFKATYTSNELPHFISMPPYEIPGNPELGQRLARVCNEHDAATWLGALGWSDYDAPAEVITPYFGPSGTGQINAVFPLTPQSGRAVPSAMASSAAGCLAFGRF
jgi:aromatic ring-opening dioxygenase catalytic subunit (LigB family)